MRLPKSGLLLLSLTGFLVLNGCANDSRRADFSPKKAVLGAGSSTAAALKAQSDRFEKLKAVLDHLGIAEEPSYSPLVELFDARTTRAEFETRLKYIDPKNELQRYASWDDEGVRVFLDRDTKKKEDFYVRFAPKGTPRASRLTSAWDRLKAVANNSQDLPLQGLRVAIDAGHMNSPGWDRRTGKYVERGSTFVSEGFINLMTAKALQRELRRLGAETLLTRETPDPVAKDDFDTFDTTPFEHAEFIAATDQNWMNRILSEFEVGPQLFASIRNAPEAKKIFSDLKKLFYFTHRADLMARAEKANAFAPDLNVVIHYDASSESPGIPIDNITRTYVEGNVMQSEAASREDRALVLRELLNPVRWEQSVDLSKKMVKALSRRIKVPLKKTPTDFGAIRVVDGVYARNLGLTRRIHKGLLTYFECAMYENFAEFRRMAKRDSIHGNYPARVDEVAEGLTQGILDFFGRKDVRYTKHTRLP